METVICGTDWRNEPAPTHRCKVCGALWRFWPKRDSGHDDSWNLRSTACGKCCDTAPMGEQIEPLTLGEIEKYLAARHRTINTIFELTFMDGQKRTVEALNFSSAKTVAAYKRHAEEGCASREQLTVDEKKCRQVGATPNVAVAASPIDWGRVEQAEAPD